MRLDQLAELAVEGDGVVTPSALRPTLLPPSVSAAVRFSCTSQGCPWVHGIR